jgi:hypothetical protein
MPALVTTIEQTKDTRGTAFCKTEKNVDEKVIADIFALVRDSNHFDTEFSGAHVLLPVQFA